MARKRKPPDRNSTLSGFVARFVSAITEASPDSPKLALPTMPGCSLSLSCIALASAAHPVTLCVVNSPHELESLFSDLRAFTPASNMQLMLFPVDASTKGEARDPDEIGTRMLVLRQLAQPTGKGPLIIVTCIQALQQRSPAPKALMAQSRELAVGGEADPSEVMQWLDTAGYQVSPEVQDKMQAALRGGILDVWPPSSSYPLRIELFGSDIESIRKFDPGTQRSIEKCESCWIDPLLTDAIETISLIEALPGNSAILWAEHDEMMQVAEENMQQSSSGTATDSWKSLSDCAKKAKGLRQWFTGDPPPPRTPVIPCSLVALNSVAAISREDNQPDIASAERHRLLTQLSQQAETEKYTAIFLDTDGALDHTRKELPDDSSLPLIQARLSLGFSWPEAGLTIATQADLFGRRKITHRRPAGSAARASSDIGARLQDLEGLEPGSLIVHVDHGIGRYLGLTEITFNEERREVISIEYADDAKLHVPVSHTHLLSRYVGVGDHTTRLHQLGGKRWNKERINAERAVEDLAASLLETQAQRATHKGIASSPDTTWDHEFEAAFPYEETPDQHTVIDEIRVDMQSNRPMDRLICGDAGYGKTELAMRAAFKTVMQERQVALLVPTTVLAQQHFDTFRERMSPYPINIAMLSRFCSASERADTIDSLQKGTTDIVIGTHALIQPKISFKKLGLVIIDEEQRFGVKHKEQFKKVRSLVDVLTMTATPIPRTLYMSLTGARDLSLLQTPPRQRVPIDTRVVRDSDETIRNAILHELHRNGQIYFLYNRVMTIDAMYERLQRIVPEARIAVGHGQMPAKQLANIMHEFSAGKHDVLLCTTIIESGVDIPRANTILIHRADRFGIADLYQLRGRVGRSNRKAFAYLMLPSHGNVDSHARKRISAIRTHSGLGAGFRLAMRDLEIRGAGNMLGSAQSGHIAAMGFSLYCQLLKRTVARLKGEPLPNLVDVELRLDFIDLSIHSEDSLSGACLPLSYIEDDRQRLGVYRRIAEAVDENEIKDVRNDMRDRFGSMPPQTERLIRLNEIRIHAAARNITRIECRNKQLRFYRDNKLMNINGQNASGSTPDQTLKNLKNFICRIPTSD